MAQRRSTSICREGYYYLMVLGFVVTGAFLREINLLLVLAGMMLGPFLINWRMASASMRRLKVRRKVPPSIQAGELLTVEMEIAKPPRRLGLFGPTSWAVQIEDLILRLPRTWRSVPFRGEAVLWRLQPGEKKKVSYRGRLPRRGKYRLGPLRLSSRFPLGLVRRTLLIPQYEEMIVFPRLGRLTQAWMRHYQDAFGGGGQQRLHGFHDGDFHSLREWRPGDGTRWIHWRSTARHGAPIVRQFERPQNRNTALLLDLWRDGSHQQDEAIERAVRFAATVASDLCRRGGSLLVLATAGKQIGVIQGAASNTLLAQILEHLSVVEAGKKDLLSHLADLALAKLRPGTWVTTVTTYPGNLDERPGWRDLLERSARFSEGGRVVSINVTRGELEEYFIDGDSPRQATPAREPTMAIK